jgi:hypothetical protein
MPIKLNSTGGGSVTIDVPSMSTANTLTLPAITGNVITSSDSNTVTQTMINRSSFYGGFGPAFHAYRTSSDQTGTQNTYVKVQFNAEDFDTAGCYDSSTNYRFTPNVAGYYYIYATVINNPSSGTQTQLVTRFYKNGGPTIPYGNLVLSSGLGGGTSTALSQLLYMNGSTDYVEVYQYSTAAVPTYQQNSCFGGYLARPA